MNKIYKVVWSKVKNCYVVVSEIAKNVITGSVKSAKIGSTPVAKGMAIGALMAFVITGNAWAETQNAIYSDFYCGTSGSQLWNNDISVNGSTNGGSYAVSIGNNGNVFFGGRKFEINGINNYDENLSSIGAVQLTGNAHLTIDNNTSTIIDVKNTFGQSYGIVAEGKSDENNSNVLAHLYNDVDATVTGCSAYGIHASGSSIVNVGDVYSNGNSKANIILNVSDISDTVDNSNESSEAIGITSENGATVVVDADKFTVNTSSHVTGSLQVSDENSLIAVRANEVILNGAMCAGKGISEEGGTSSIIINANETSITTSNKSGIDCSIDVNGGFVAVTGDLSICSTGYSAYGINANSGADVDVYSGAINVNIGANSIGETGEAVAIYANDSQIDVMGETVEIKATGKNIEQQTKSVQAENGGIVTVAAGTAHVIGDVIAKNGAEVTVTDDDTNVSGNICAYGKDSLVIVDAYVEGNIIGNVYGHNDGCVNMELTNKESSFTGATDGSVLLELKNNASWYVTEDSNIASLIGDRFNITAADGVENVNVNISRDYPSDINNNDYDYVSANVKGVNLFIEDVNGVGLIDGNTIVSDSDVSIYVGEHGIAITNGGEASVIAKNVTIDSFKAAIWANDKVDSSVFVKAIEDVKLTSEDRFAVNNESVNGGSIDIFGKDVTIISEDRTAVKAGGTASAEGYNGIVNVTGECITVEGATQAPISGNKTNGSVIYAQGNGVVNLSATDNAVITDAAKVGGNAIGVYNGGTVNVKDAEDVAINGKVYTTGNDSRVNITNVENVIVTSTNGSAINSVSNDSAVSIGDETTKTVLVTGTTQNLHEVYDGKDIINFNEDNRAVVFARGDVYITATDKVEITDSNEGKAIDAHGGANVIINGGYQTVINGEVYADGHEYAFHDGEIEHEDSSKGENIYVTILGSDIAIDANGGEGVFARGDSIGGDNAVITVGDADTENLTINNTTIGLFAWYDGSKVEVNGGSLEISASGNEEDAGIGIYASNNGAVHNNPATVNVNVNAVQTKIAVSGEEHAGIWADSYGVVNVNGDLEVNAENAIMATEGGTVNIIEANAEINGKVYATGEDSEVNFANIGKLSVTESKDYGIVVNNGGEVNIVANDVELTTGKAGVEATNGDSVDITATNVTFKSGGAYVNSEKGGAVHITNETEAGSVVSIKASENVELISTDRYAINNKSKQEGLVEVIGKSITVISENRTAVKAGGHVGNEGLNGTVTIGDEITETITIKGRAQNPHKDNQPNEHKGAVVYAQSGTVNLSATDEIEITNTNTENRIGKAVAAYDGGNINIKDTANLAIDGEVYATGKGFVNIADVGNVTITEAKEHGISVNGSGKVDVTAENVTIDSSKAAIWLDDKGDNEVTINANGSVNLTSEDRFAVNNESVDGVLIDINGKDITIISENRTAIKAGGVLGREGKFGTIDISGEIVTIKGSAQEPYKDNQPNEHNASVVYAQGKGIINLSATDKLAIVDTAKVGGYAISAYEGAAVNIKDTNNVAVDGNVYANGEGSRVNIEANKGSINGNVEAENNASVVVNLKSKGASFTGATNVNNAEKGVTLILQQGATWNVTGDSTVSSVCGDNFNITKASNVGVNEEVTVTLDGKHADGMHDDFESTTTNIYGVDLVIREKNESGLGGTVTLNSDSDITVEGAHHAIHTNGNDVVNITTDKLTLVNGTGFDAIRAEDGGKVNIDADDVALTSKVYTNGDGSIVDIAGVNNVLITSTNGSAINNASDGATIKIGDEGTKTVAITGATEGSREVYDGQGNFVNYNEDNRAVIYSKGTVNIIANEKVVINDTGVKTKAVSAYGDANVTIDGGKETIINGEITADGYGPVLQSDGDVEHQDNGIADNINVVIKGKDIIVDASLEAEEGVFARGDSTGIDNAVIIVGDTNTEKVTVRDVDTGLFAWNGGSKVEVNSDSLVISADGNFKDSGIGICAINSSDANNKLAIVKVNAGETKITVDDGAFAYGIYANGKSNVDVTGNINIATNGISAFGVEADKSAIVVLGDGNSTVTFDVNADELDYEGESRAEAIAARENNSVTVLGNMNATVNGRDWVAGVESEDGSVVELGNVTLNISGIDSSEASGINVAREGTVKVNGNLEATVTGGEWASGVEAYNGSNINIGNGSSEVKLTATTNGTESSDKDWEVSAFGILSVGQTKPIIADNEEDNEYAYGGSTVNINASQLTIDATSSYGEAYGIYVADAGVVNVQNATNAEINGKVFATGEGSQVNFTNSGDVNITETKEHGIAVNNGGKVDVTAENVTIDSYKAAIWLDDLGDNAVTIKANENINLTSEDRFAVNNESIEGSLIDISGKNVVVTSEDRTAVKAGGTLGKEGKNGTVNISGETVSIQGFAQNTVVDGKANEHNASVVYAQGKGVVNLSATNALKITDTAKVGGNAVSVYEGGTINIKDTANLVVDGAVYANGEGSRVNIEANKGSVNGNVEAEDNASIVVTLESKEASFTGATKVTNAEKGVTLNLQQGATWCVTGDSTVSSVIGDEFNITKATGVNEEVTVTLDGRHADDIADDYDSTTSTITGVDLILYEDNGLNGNQTIISDSDVTLHSKGNGINVVDGNYVSIQAAEFTLNQGTGFDAIRAENGGKVNIAADNAVFNGSVYASGVGSEVDFSDTENVTVDGTYSVVKVIDNAIVKAGNITLTGNGEEGKVEAIGVNKGNFVATGNVSVSARGYSVYGVEAVAGSTVEIGSSDKDVTFTITSTGVDSNLEDKEYPEAQAISAEGGSKVTVNANKLDIITTANSKVTGSLQARDNDSLITVNATDVDVTGDIFAGEGAKVDINTTTFATKGNIGSEGVIDIITGDVAYGAGTQFYTEGSGAINLAGGNVSGVLNIAKGNVNLTGATFTVANLNDAIKGAGKLVVDGSGVLKTTADQVFTVGDAETVDVETLGKNGINDIAKEKVTFKSGSLSLSDDYSYDYLTSITDVMKEDNGNATKLVMTGTLKNATSINPDDIETDENNQLDVNDASNLGSDVHLDNVTVKTDNNLLIGGSASKDTPVEVDGVKATDSVANGFSADGLDLGNADGAIITGGKEVTLGGSNGNDKIVSSTVESTTLVVGTGGDEPNAKGTLNIGTNNDADYKHHGKVHVNHGSDLNAKGKTKITGGVELEGGNLNVDEKGHLEADIIVESKKDKGNNGNNGNDNGNNRDKDKVTITGKVTGNLKVKDKPEGHPSTMIHLGNENVAGKMHAKEAKLNGVTLFLDPDNASNISEASMFTLANADTLDGNYVAGKNSVIAFGVSGADEVEEAFAKTGLAFGHDGDVDSVVYIAKAIDVANGSIIAKGALTQAPDSYTNGEVKFAAHSVLMVDAEDVKAGPVIKGVKNVNIVQPDVQNNIVGAKLYIDDVNIDDAQKGTQYTIFEGLNSVGVNASWAAENISTNNQLIKFTDASIVNGRLELKADGVQKVNDVYKGEVVAGDVVDKAIDTDASSSDFFNSAVDQKVNANKASQADGVNSSLAMNEVAGVTHTTYAVSNILTDAVADHMSLANGKEHDKDIWAHYVHTKEDVDGLEYDVHSTQYSAQYNGVVVGTDLYKEGKVTVGAALTYVDGNINGSSVAARTENDAKYYGASIYGSIQNDYTAVIADVSYLHGEHDIIQRNSGKVITGEPETDAFSVGVRVEKEAKAGIGKLVPYAGLRYMHLGTGNYTNSIGLAYDADDAELFLLPVGLKYSADIKNTNGWTMRPVVEFGYVWAFGDTDADQTVSLNGASNGFGYDVSDSGSYVGRFMFEAEKANISYALGYEYQKGDNVEADKWMVNVNWKF